MSATGATRGQIAAAIERSMAELHGIGIDGPRDHQEVLMTVAASFLVPPGDRIMPLDLLRRVSDLLDGHFLDDDSRATAQAFRDAAGLP